MANPKPCRLSDLTHLELQVYAMILGAKDNGLIRDQLLDQISFRKSVISTGPYITRLKKLGLIKAAGKRKADKGWVQTIWKINSTEQQSKDQMELFQ